MKKDKDILTLLCGWALLVAGLIYFPIFLAPLIFILIEKAIRLLTPGTRKNRKFNA